MAYNIWMTSAGKLRNEAPMTETPYRRDRPLVAAPPNKGERTMSHS
jgi:cytochrome c oxidase cbb3-type subunit 1